MNYAARKAMTWTTLAVAAMLLWPQPALAARKVLRVWLDGPVGEAPNQMDLFSLLKGEEPKTLYDLVKTLDGAAKDKDIAGIALIIEQPEMSLAQAEEFTHALNDFRAAGKKVYCYLDYASNLSYALACAADHITLAEHSELDIVGLNASMMFYKGLLDKIGVQADMLHCGAYKSAVEPFTRTAPSKEAAENINWLLDGIYSRWLQLIADGRKLSVDQVRAAVDDAPLHADQALKLKLVDEVSSFGAFRQMIRKEFGKDAVILKRLKSKSELELDFNNPFAMFQWFGKLFKEPTESAKARLALIYIDGDIVMGKDDVGAFGGTAAGSDTIRAACEKARRDDNIKAVVVRVDSPGGSALASDIMWKAATRCSEEKPLIVSMSGVAGSGGYYVSIPGETIFADDSTITGSIGVLGGKLVWHELMAGKLGITTTEFSRGARAGIMSPNRPWTDEERKWMQGYMDSIYAQFKGRVMESRGTRIKGDLDQLAGGRVYTGKQALEHGLVDRIGGLKDALAYAAQKADLGEDYNIQILPKPLDAAEILKKLFGEDTEDEFEIALHTGLASDPLMRALLPLLAKLAPDEARAMARDFQNLIMLNHERVGCFMPEILHAR